jgi:hypothetical protein
MNKKSMQNPRSENTPKEEKQNPIVQKIIQIKGKQNFRFRINIFKKKVVWIYNCKQMIKHLRHLDPLRPSPDD